MIIGLKTTGFHSYHFCHEKFTLNLLHNSLGSSSASTLQMNIQRRDQTPQVSATSVINDDNRLRG